jgi:hypothetical protein
MYMIWDAKIWKSYQADKGWQRYTGASPHTDHVHFSLSWAGAYAKTSYWTGTVAPVMPGPVPPPATLAPTRPAGSADHRSRPAAPRRRRPRAGSLAPQ